MSAKRPNILLRVESCKKSSRPDPRYKAPPPVIHEPVVLKYKNSFRIIEPYFFTYVTNVKGRWVGKSILSVFQQEFRDRPMSYYKLAIEQGHVKINGNLLLNGGKENIPAVEYKLKQGDVLEHFIHRHEPAISHERPKVVFRDEEMMVLNKPSSIPCHPTGRYFYNSVNECIRLSDFAADRSIVFSNVNRLDRLTSGLMLVGLTPEKASWLHTLMESRSIRKEYIAKVKGNFIPDEITVDKPIMSVNHKIGLGAIANKYSSPPGSNISDLYSAKNSSGSKNCPEPCKSSITHFRKLSYDPISNTSLLICHPLTGRTHQIRIHLQYLGYSIVGDTLYGSEIWNEYYKEKQLELDRSLNNLCDTISPFRSIDSAQNSSLSYSTLTHADLMIISQRILDSVLPADNLETILHAERDFSFHYSQLMSESESLNGNNITNELINLPRWFDKKCDECLRQWLRSYRSLNITTNTIDESEYIPLIEPLGTPPVPAQLCLHAFKYYSNIEDMEDSSILVNNEDTGNKKGSSWSYEVPWPEWATQSASCNLN